MTHRLDARCSSPSAFAGDPAISWLIDLPAPGSAKGLYDCHSDAMTASGAFDNSGRPPRRRAKTQISPALRVRRGPAKGLYDRPAIDAVLDGGLVAHVAFMDGATPLCIPMLYARVVDEIYVHGSAASRAMRRL